MSAKYKVGDILVCGKYVGIAEYVGELQYSHYKTFQQSLRNDNIHLKPDEIWIGLRLAESPEMNSLPFMFCTVNI